MVLAGFLSAKARATLLDRQINGVLFLFIRSDGGMADAHRRMDVGIGAYRVAVVRIYNQQHRFESCSDRKGFEQRAPGPIAQC